MSVNKPDIHEFSAMAYLKPRHYKILIAKCYIEFESKSAMLEKSWIELVNKIDAKEQDRLVDLYNELPEDVRKNPKKFRA